MNLRAVIFDMDGVIFDSEKAVLNCWQSVAQKHGLADLEIPFIQSLGTDRNSTRRNFLNFYGQDFPFDEYNAEKSVLYHSLYDGGRLPLKPGIRELLEYLRSHGCSVAVASSSRCQLVISQLKNADLFDYFDFVVGGDMISRSKPFPDIFLKAAEQLDCPVCEIMVIEDSYNGIRAAYAAGMIPVMVPDLLPPDSEMRRIAAHIFGSLADLQSYLENCKISRSIPN